MAPEVDLLGHGRAGTVETDDQRAADRSRIDGEGRALTRRGADQESPTVMHRERADSLRPAPFPYRRFDGSLDGRAGVCDFDPDRKRSAELENAVISYRDS